MTLARPAIMSPAPRSSSPDSACSPTGRHCLGETGRG